MAEGVEVYGPLNGARDVPCFYCRNSVHIEGGTAPRANGGFHHQYRCKMGLRMPDRRKAVDDIDIVRQCPSGAPQLGFQIGGYYSHMWFEGDEPDGCLEWKICSDGEFPSEKAEIEFHICDFKQIESFVAFWGKELRRRGVVTDEV